MIRIMKASAGSGKTWNLARQYIRLLFEGRNERSYRHILAVTFTNKATDEMKDRILKELHKLSVDPSSSDYYEDFVPSMFPDASSLSEAAETMLCNILHDYSAFAVSTIDRFFQQTLKAFAREIGQFSSYAIELDKDSLVKESVDRLLDSLTETEGHKRSLEWMTRKTLSQLEEGDGYKLDYTLKKIADRFNSEEFRVALEKAGKEESALCSDERLNVLEEGCIRICKDYVSLVKEGAQRIGRQFEEAGLDPYDTYKQFMSSLISRYSSLEEDAAVPKLTDAVMRRASDVGQWFTKANRYKEAMVTSGIVDAVADFISLFGQEYKVYNTAGLLKKQIYGFAVSSDLYASFQALMKEKNVLTIDQTNDYLRKIIDGSDTPFIYEKLGVRYDHFLLDEFQDTSFVQWDNFRPLIDNSVAGGNENLIVGDVKQSIYRFRQSEWELLENQVQEDFPDRTKVTSLDTNYRSCTEIVEFNNAFFRASSEYLDRRSGDGSKVISGLYSDVSQKVSRKGQGMVEVSFCEKESLHQRILESIRKAVEAGFSLGDITVLVRWNKEGGAIAAYLLENGIPVVSDDSLRISSSLTVRRLVSLLAGIENPEDTMSRHLASSLGVDVPSEWHSLVDLCEGLLRGLSDADKELFDSELPYVQSFMDMLLDYVSSEGNSLRGFLKKWSEDESSISSPDSGDSVRVMTIHKSKGLDFPYVILPSAGEVEFYRFKNRWTVPDVTDTALVDVADGVYDITLSEKSSDTLFEQRYREERLMQYVDNINVMYVAMTRASKAMTLISPYPSGVVMSEDGYVGDEQKFGCFSQWMMAFMATSFRSLGFEIISDDDTLLTFVKGHLEAPEERHKSTAEPMDGRFASWPLNPSEGDVEEDVRERGRLKFSSEAVDFFNEDGGAGVSASNRIRGVVLHDILSRVVVPEDLEVSVARSVSDGDLTEEEGKEAYGLLETRIAEVKARGWFPQERNCVMNEVELIDVDGSSCRPDRVVVKDGRVVIIDYKFGEHDRRYIRQVRKYMDIWRRMGYADVSGWLWYVQRGEVVETV